MKPLEFRAEQNEAVHKLRHGWQFYFLPKPFGTLFSSLRIISSE